MIEPGEKCLLDMARAGDQGAFAELFRESRRQIESVGREILSGPGAESHLEDFCSDVWLLGLKYVGTFRGECSFTTWIVKIARSKALAILQKRGQSKNGDGRLVYQRPEMSDEQWESECFAGGDRRFEAASAKSDVRRLLEGMSPEPRALIQLYHLEGFTETEIARQTGLSVAAVRSRLWRAMVQMRKKVEKGANRNAPKISLTIQRVILREGESSE